MTLLILVPIDLILLDVSNIADIHDFSKYRFESNSYLYQFAHIEGTLYYQYSSYTWFEDYYRYTYKTMLGRIDISNTEDIQELPALEIPGTFVGASEDGSYLYTWQRAYFWDNAKNGTFTILSVEGNTTTIVKAIRSPWYLRSV